MAPRPSQIEPVTADDVLTVQFTHIKRGGYDTQEVDAFLDRIAVTFDAESDRGIHRTMSADDVRTAQFGHAKRGGYDTGEVDNFLDRIVEVFTGAGAVQPEPVASSAEQQEPIVEPSILDDHPDPFEPQPNPVPSEADLGMEAAAPAATPGPSSDSTADALADLESPEPIVEVAQPTETAPPETPNPAETIMPSETPLPPQAPVPAEGTGPRLHDPEGAAQKLLAAAQMAADSLTADADAYAQTVRGEADSYDSDTRSEADEHAATVTTTAETQAAAIREVAADEARRVAEEARSELLAQIDMLSAAKVVLERDNAALQSKLDTERGRILAIIEDVRTTLVADGGVAQANVPSHAHTDVAAEVDAAFTAAEAEPEFEPEPLSAVGSVSQIQPRVEPDPPDMASVPDAAAEASRSVFDVGDDATAEEAETSTDWIDASPAPLPDAEPEGDATIFDIEAEPAATEDPGDRFFDELRQADADADKLGPADDDTDAALSAFFEPEEEPDTDGRWRDRFGPGRS